MTILESVLLGLLQGLTEFLPVSSSGHLTVFQHILSIPQENLALNVALHVGTLFSILAYYGGDLIKTLSYDLLLKLFVTSLPTAIIGLVMKKLLPLSHLPLVFISFFFFSTALLLFWTDRKLILQKENLDLNTDQITLKSAFIIGLSQGVAVLPGISRSGATIATSILLGIDRRTAAFYSFVCSLPAIGGAALLELKDADILAEQMQLYLLGALVSAVVGWVCLVILEKYFLIKAQLKWFGFYLLAVSLVGLFL